MAKNKDDIKYGTAQGRLSEDEAVRVAYKHGTPLEGGKIADSEPVDLFSSAHGISKANTPQQGQPADSSTTDQSQQHREPDMDGGGGGGGGESNTRSAKFPNKSPPSLNTKYV